MVDKLFAPLVVRRSTFIGVFLIGLSLGAARAEEAGTDADQTSLPQEQIEEIRARIKTLHSRQTEVHKKIAKGEITPNQDLLERWPQITEEAGAIRELIDSLNALGTDSPERPALQDKLFDSLQRIGIHLESASHPDFTPRILDAADTAEMKRIENAIAGLKFGDRNSATPVKLLGPDPSFTLIHLPAPVVLQCRPGDRVFLAATTGGAFHNGLSMIELQADGQGIAKTTWVSIGDAVGDCHIAIYSQAAIETQEIRIKVVSPSLPALEGLPQPEHLKGEIPRLKSKLTTAKGRASQITE